MPRARVSRHACIERPLPGHRFVEADVTRESGGVGLGGDRRSVFSPATAGSNDDAAWAASACSKPTRTSAAWFPAPIPRAKLAVARLWLVNIATLCGCNLLQTAIIESSSNLWNSEFEQREER